MECPLHPAELRVMRMILDGFSYDEIAEKLGRSERTIRKQAMTARRQLGVKSNVEAAVVMMRGGWHTQAMAADLGTEPGITPWVLAYLYEFDRFLLGPVECRNQARNRSGLALLGLGYGARWRERDRLPPRLAWMLGLTESGIRDAINSARNNARRRLRRQRNRRNHP